MHRPKMMERRLLSARKKLMKRPAVAPAKDDGEEAAAPMEDMSNYCKRLWATAEAAAPGWLGPLPSKPVGGLLDHLKVVKSVQRGKELWQIKDSNRSLIQITTSAVHGGSEQAGKVASALLELCKSGVEREKLDNLKRLHIF